MALSATVELISAPDQVQVGVPFSASFRVSNHGNETLTPGRDKLGAWGPQDNHLWGDTRAQLPSPIGAGQAQNFEVATFVAQQAGLHIFSWRMVREGVAWFGAFSALKTITVLTLPTPPGPNPPPNPSGVIIGKWPARRGDPFDLLGCMAINTDAFVANGSVRQSRWTNQTSERVHICAARIWLGVSMGGRCDAHGQLEREDGTLVAVLQADHYVDGPHGAAVERQDWNGAYIALAPGESLIFTYFANGFTPGCQAHFTVSIWGHSA